jgi:hypothetical protein
MTRYLGGGALAERVAALEAERLAPVPRASRAVGVKSDEQAVVLEYMRTRGRNSRPTWWEATSSPLTGGWMRLFAATPGSSRDRDRRARAALFAQRLVRLAGL